MQMPLRDDLAFQRYRTTNGAVIAAYTLGKNQFTVLEDDAAILVEGMLDGMEREAILKPFLEQFGSEAKAEASDFLDSVAPLFFETSHAISTKQLNERLNSPAALNSTEEETFYNFCAIENLFAASSWELSYSCNLRCNHCYNPHHDNTGQMDTDGWLDLLDQARAMGMLRLCLTGGETGVHPGFWKIIAKARRLHLAVDVLTNGLVFADLAAAEELASLYPRSVQCSLYGATRETHEAITMIPGSWRKTMTALENFSSLGVPIALKCPAMQNNFREIPEVSKIAMSLGAMLQVDVNITARNDGNTQPTELRLNKDQLGWLFSQPGLPLYQGSERATQDQLYVRDLEDGVCGAGTNGLSVQPDGTVIPCLSFGLSLGKLNEKSLSEIWHGPARSDWRAKKRKNCVDCAHCENVNFCSFCPGMSLNETGDFLDKNQNDCCVAGVRAMVFNQLSASKT